MKLITVAADHPLRSRAARLIRATYLLHYGARLMSIPRVIVALADDREKIHAAAGLRDHSEQYYSEYYLDRRIEDILGGISLKPVGREKIVEVSSLASRTPAISVQFMQDLVFYGEELGFDWAFFTATSRLEKLLRRMRLPLIHLATADSNRVPSPELWGSYYDSSPRVLAFGREQLKPFMMKKPAQAKRQEFCLHG